MFLDYDQTELDAAYNQLVYAPNQQQITDRWLINSDLARARIGAPQRSAYGPTGIEQLDLYRTKAPKAPINVFIHGGLGAVAPRGSRRLRRNCLSRPGHITWCPTSFGSRMQVVVSP